MKRVISMNYGSCTSSWKPWRWVRLDLILSMKDIYISSNLKPLTKLTNSSRSTEFKDIIPWRISQKITNTVLISMRIVLSFAIKPDIPFWIWMESQQKGRQHDQNYVIQNFLAPQDLRNTHTNGNSCRDALPYANMALKLPWYFYMLTEKPVQPHSATRKPLFPYLLGDRSGLRKPKKDQHQH